jgi:uncharacterized protein YjiK
VVELQGNRFMSEHRILGKILNCISLLALLSTIACGGGGGGGGRQPDTNNTLNVEVTGSGTITSSPSGISCGSDCTQEYSNTTSVTLTATPSAGFSFVRWEGACTGSGSCVVSMTSDRNVRAVFEEIDNSLFTLTVATTGSGQVSSNPAGIDCGADCSEQYQANTNVTLTATAEQGFVFQQWQGACSGSGACSVSMTGDLSVTAEFVEQGASEFQLTVTTTGSGSVTSTPAGIDCGSDCTEIYQTNTNVTLTANPEQGFVLDHWEGACSGNNSCVISMNSAKSVTAVFAVEGQHSVLIENYSAPNDAFQLGQIPENASGITWHAGLQEYLVVQNNAARIYRYDVNFAFLGSVNVTDIDTDTEGLAYVSDNEVLVVSESNTASRVTIAANTESVNGQPPTSQRYQILAQQGGNQGLEGIAVRKPTANTPARVFACKEGGGGDDLRVVYFDMPEDSSTVYDQQTNLTVEEPFNAVDAFRMVVGDLAGMVYDARTDHLIIVSEQSDKAIQVNPYTGAVISELLLDGAPQYEGVTIGPNDELVFVSEANWIRIYTQN